MIAHLVIFILLNNAGWIAWNYSTLPRQLSAVIPLFLAGIMVASFRLIFTGRGKRRVSPPGDPALGVRLDGSESRGPISGTDPASQPDASSANPEPKAGVCEPSILRHIPGLICIKDGRGRWLHASIDYLEVFGLEEVDYPGRSSDELGRLPKSAAEALRLEMRAAENAWEHGRPLRFRTIIETRAGQHRALEFTHTPVFHGNGQRRVMIVSALDITRQKKIERELSLIANAFNHNIQAMAIMDERLNLLLVNAAFTALTGYRSRDAVGKHVSVLSNGRYDPEFFQILLAAIRNGGQWQGEMECRRPSGECFPANMSLVPVKRLNPDRIPYHIGIFSDMTEQKASEKRMVRLAYYDDLTGLPNRVMFVDRLKRALARSEKQQTGTVILFLDLDRFKSVNDSFGHRKGDELLKQTAQRLISVLRKDDLIARLSGDEFAVLMDGVREHDKTSYLASLAAQKIISALSKPFLLQGHEIFLTASIGISLFPQDARTPEILMKNADAALYHAKRRGRSNYQFYKRALNQTSSERLRIESDLRKALERGQFQLYYQPQIDAQTGLIIAAEALLRWQAPALGMVPPSRFIPLIEETGLIVPVGKWVLETACKTQKAWISAGYPIQRLAVNLSARQFSDSSLVYSVGKILEKHGLHPRHLELEITESLLMENTARTENALLRLHQMGIALSIDDFGTGYSSLAYLKNFPLDALKIDRSFVTGVPNDEDNAAISRTIIAMAHSLGLKVVAEGVETEEQRIFLEKYRCDLLQGFYFSPPQPEKALEAILKNPASMLAREPCVRRPQQPPDNPR